MTNYVLYEIWNKKKDFRLGDVDVAKLSEQQTDVALQIDPTLDSEERKVLDFFIQYFFDKVDDLRKGLEYLKTAQGESKQMIQVNDSGHYHHSPDGRREIVRKYREGRRKGEILNKDAWAKQNHMITGKTLLNYEREFPEEV
jgi:hypothetical protein